MFIFSRENTGKLARWWRNVDKPILFSIISLFLLGSFFSFSSTSTVIAEKMNKQTYFFFTKHLIFCFFSLFLLVVISIQDKNKLIKYLPYLFFVSIFFLSLIPIMGVEIKGSKRWLDLILLPRFQRVELVKQFLIIFVAKIITLNQKTNIYSRYFYSFLALLLIVIFLINQPDLGQTLLLILTWVTMIFVSGFNMLILSILGILFLTFIAFLIFLFPSKFGYVF